ncbi:hypothetical protein SAMN04487996_110104 [Dyadobacter soli]|uniref:DUF5618 domain-containing protein n=2 Tax=Dyadobacter soli TaxID=659014 RepID=A0A1G7KFQ4_9BACT|nr:hypothetical protein SAMN04487996_110104 [Dyadobacter soli]
MAARTAFKGVLIAVRALFELKSREKRNIWWYEEHLELLDKSVSVSFETTRLLLYDAMGRRGITSVEIASLAFQNADEVVQWVENHTADC